MTAATYGYARVSTTAQTLDQQFDALLAADCSKVFSDKLSGSRADRHGLADCIDQLRTGDTLVVVALDRLGRTTIQVLSTLRDLHDRGIVVRSLRESLDFSTPLGQAVATIMSALAEMELALIRERAAAAREAARARGRRVGRPPALTQEQAALLPAECASPARPSGRSPPRSAARAPLCTATPPRPSREPRARARAALRLVRARPVRMSWTRRVTASPGAQGDTATNPE